MRNKCTKNIMYAYLVWSTKNAYNVHGFFNISKHHNLVKTSSVDHNVSTWFPKIFNQGTFIFSPMVCTRVLLFFLQWFVLGYVYLFLQWFVTVWHCQVLLFCSSHFLQMFITGVCPIVLAARRILFTSSIRLSFTAMR